MRTVKGQPINVYIEKDADFLGESARELADRLGTELLPGEERGEGELCLLMTAEGLALSDGNLRLSADFTPMEKRLTRANLPRELLVKAARLKNQTGQPLAVDATAGLGEDSLLLAAAGFDVRLYEYNPVIAALLRDALRRAGEVPSLSAAVSRMKVFEEDSVAALPLLEQSPDVVLLDPMFPARQKSALIKKKFQLLQQLECPCSEESALLAAAGAASPRKIIIKRPLKGPFLADKKPSYSLEGKAIRYDVHVYARE